MKRHSILSAGVLAACILALCGTGRADWPQYMGPDRNGISAETGLMHAWPAEGPAVLWTTPLGEGFAGPAIANGEVYILDRVENKTDILRCLSFENGTELWNISYDAPGTVGHNGSRTAPTVDDKYVYTVGLMGNFLCTDRKTHQVKWQKNLVTDFGSELPRWGVAQCPLLYKDVVIVCPQAPDAFTVAYDRETGDIRWKTPSPGLAGYVSPVIATLDGVEQLVVVSASNKDASVKGAVSGLSLKDGSVLWRYDGWQCWIPIPYPTPVAGDRLFITGGYGAGSVMLQVKKSGANFEVSEVYRLDSETCGSQVHQPIIYKDHIYLNSNSNESKRGLSCFTLDGKLKWRTTDTPDLPIFGLGSLIFADGMLIMLDGNTGILHLVEPNPDGYKELARTPVVEGREMWAPLALTDGKLLVRSQSGMKCLKLKE